MSTNNHHSLPSWAYFWRRIPNCIRGKARLARLFLRPILSRRDVDIDLGGFSFRAPILCEPIAFSVLINGVYEPDTQRFLEKHLRRDSVFIDVGANIGLFSIQAARNLCPEGRVLALEASPTIFQYLERNLEKNAVTNLISEHVAVAASDEGTLSFYEASTESFGMGSLSPRFEGDPIKVSCASLDGLISRHQITGATVMKVDVEGYERGVFEGARDLLSGPQPPVIVFEFLEWAESSAGDYRPGDAQDFLRSMGFSIWTLSDYLAGNPPCPQTLTTGAHNLVAARQ